MPDALIETVAERKRYWDLSFEYLSGLKAKAGEQEEGEGIERSFNPRLGKTKIGVNYPKPVPKIFISYKHNAQPDVRLAMSVVDHLKAHGNEVFVDSEIKVGEEWPRVIEQNLRSSDFLIVFLSSMSSSSEMVIEEVNIARRVSKESGRPKLIPVRVAYEDDLPYDLGAWLDRIQQACWRTAADDRRILEQLVSAIGGAELTSPARQPAFEIEKAPLPMFDPRWLDALDSGTGAMRLTNPFYIEREFDGKARKAIVRSGETILIRGSRQSGKSSALARLCQHAKSKGQQTVFIDFQSIDKLRLQNFDTLLRHLANVIAARLKTNQNPDPYWASPLGSADKLNEFLENEVLRHATLPFLLALDEVDKVFDFPHSSDFFGILRSWHNKRAFEDSWNNLNLLLAYSTESSLLITDQNQSPFNIGEQLESADFTRDQVSELNRRHGSPLKSLEEIDSLASIVSGHPYLVRKALFEMTTNGRTLLSLTACAADDDGPFSDHLQRSLLFLSRNAPLGNAFKSLLQTGVCDNDDNFYHLRSAGLVQGHSRHAANPRCGLYRSYFGARL